MTRKRYYVGHTREVDVVFRSAETPTVAKEGKSFFACTGPFRTKRAGVYARLWARESALSECERRGEIGS